jgi:hypothetical protein
LAHDLREFAKGASSGFNAFFTPMSPRLSQMASATGQVDNGSHASGS